MKRRVSMSIILVLALSLALCGEAQVQHSTSRPIDHVTSSGPDELGKQVRYLFANWPYDFEIAVLKILGKPMCNRPGDEADCQLQVQLIELILGHQGNSNDPIYRGNTFIVLFRHPERSGSSGDVGFELKKGDRVVAMLAPVIASPTLPRAYMANRLDHATPEFVETVRKSVANTLSADGHCQVEP
jgi:hypothetical protein